ncbi:MAG: hypothetical protein DRJ42_25650 [Deltaproteobacteria bacterium]|nr:MAG: hypothetical protein DRJ42_25650 [Deltaproteobacteria bacterium]
MAARPSPGHDQSPRGRSGEDRIHLRPAAKGNAERVTKEERRKAELIPVATPNGALEVVFD